MENKEIQASEKWQIIHDVMWHNQPFDFVQLEEDNFGFHFGVFENDKLIIGNGDGKILALDLKTQQYATIAEGMGGLDGILSDGQKGYFATEWRGKIWHINPEGKTQLLLDTVDAKMNTADIEYIPSQKTLLVPTFWKNKVIAYKVN